MSLSTECATAFLSLCLGYKHIQPKVTSEVPGVMLHDDIYLTSRSIYSRATDNYCPLSGFAVVIIWAIESAAFKK